MAYLLKQIDAVLDRVTMYRLTLYVLTVIILAAIIEGALGLLPYAPSAILLSTVLAVAVCWVVNELISWPLKAAKSVESVYITAFILALILPPATLGDTSKALVVIVASMIAMASKYLIAPYKKHIFNPAALGVAATGFFMGGYASWWVGGNLALLPFVLIGGLAIVRKLRRFDLVLAFFIAALLAIVFTTPLPPFKTVQLALMHTSMLFFAFVMLTEPMTTPPSRNMRFVYGVLTGILFAPGIHIWNTETAPEIALLIGNIFAFVVSPKGRHILTLRSKEETSAVTGDFIFTPDKPFPFEAGQFLEWTIPHLHPDNRGTRRFFTIASAPTEPEVRLGVKFYGKPSTFKQALDRLVPGDRISAGNLAGEFTLPKDASKKLAFIAGGIGITPFRSHLRWLLDRNEKRDIVLFYANRTPADIAYAPILEEARQRFGTKIIHAINEKAEPGMHLGIIDEALVKAETPDYLERTFYISGPQAMVTALKSMLLRLGVSRSNIHTDYFIGFA